MMTAWTMTRQTKLQESRSQKKMQEGAGGPILDAAGQPILDEEAEEITGVPLIDKNAGVSPLNIQECPPLMKPKKLQECPTLKPTIQLIAASLASRVCT